MKRLPQYSRLPPAVLIRLLQLDVGLLLRRRGLVPAGRGEPDMPVTSQKSADGEFLQTL